MEVFGFMMLQSSFQTGVRKIQCHPQMPLEYAGWSKTYKGFVPELSWSTDKTFWSIQPQRRAVEARCYDLCKMDAVELLNIGRKLGATGQDSRMRIAMSILGLRSEDLAVPLDQKDGDLHRMRWAEVLDHLIGFQHYQTAEGLWRRLCQLHNTGPEDLIARWLQKQSWQCGLDRNVVGSREVDWVVDLCLPEPYTRIVACSGEYHCMAVINSDDWSGLQDVDPCLLQIYVAENREDLLEQISIRSVRGDSQKEDFLREKLPAGLRNLYAGQPASSSLLGLKQPRLRFAMGDLVGWQQELSPLSRRPSNNQYIQDLVLSAKDQTVWELPDSAFSRLRPSGKIGAGDSLLNSAQARIHTMPGGLMRKDLPPVLGRAEEDAGITQLYRPLNPFRAA